MLEVTNLKGHDHFRDQCFERSPKGRWGVDSGSGTLYNVGLRASEILKNLLPWQRGAFGLETPLRLRGLKEVYIRHLLAAALYSPMRYFDGHDKWSREKRRQVVLPAGEPVLDLLDRAHEYRADLGRLMEAQSEHDELSRLAEPQRFGLKPIDPEALEDMEKALEGIEKETGEPIPEKQQKLKARIEQLKSKVKSHPSPIKLLGLAIDQANFEHVRNSSDDEERRRYARRMYYHAKVLDFLGRSEEARLVTDEAMQILNEKRYTEIAEARNKLANPLPDIHGDLHEELVAHLKRQGQTWLEEEPERLLSDTKAVSGLDRKLNETIDEQGQTGWEKYGGRINNVHDAVRLKLIHPGWGVGQIRKTAEFLKSLEGQIIAGHLVQKVELNNYLHGVGERKYKAYHVIFHVASPEQLERMDDARKKGTAAEEQPEDELKKFEVQLTNDTLDHYNNSGERRHGYYTGLLDFPDIETNLPPEHLQDTITVRAVDPDGVVHEFPLSKDHMAVYVLDRLRKRRPESGVTPNEVACGTISLFERSLAAGGKPPKPVPLDAPIKPGITYHVHRVGQHGLTAPQEVSRRELREVCQKAGEEDWRNAMRAELGRIEAENVAKKDQQRRHGERRRQMREKGTRPRIVDQMIEENPSKPSGAMSRREKKYRKKVQKKKKD